MADPKHLILVVDDDAEVRRFLRILFEGAGYAVEAVDNGEAALERLATGPRPDLISLDLVMPQMTGWQVIERLALVSACPPVLLLSGLIEEGEGQLLRGPVAGIVHKANEPRLVLLACQRILQGLPEENADAPGAERRRMRRRPLIIPVEVRTQFGMTLGEGKLVRLSPIGADLESHVALPAGIVKILLPLPAREEVMEVDGQLHARGRGDRVFFYGVSFVNPAPDLRRLLEKLLVG